MGYTLLKTVQDHSQCSLETMKNITVLKLPFLLQKISSNNLGCLFFAVVVVLVLFYHFCLQQKNQNQSLELESILVLLIL